MKQSGEKIALFVQRYKLLRDLGQLQVEVEADESSYLARCCALLLQDPEFCLAWVGRQEKDNTVTPLFIAVKDPAAQHECQLLVHRLALEPEGVSPAARALATDRHVVCNDLADEANPVTLRRIAAASGGRSCISWPLIHDRQKYGVLTVQSSRAGAFADAADLDFIANVATAIARALHLWHTSTHLRLEHDFNCEIVQTVQALLVSLSPCGQILSFNPTAEEVTGYREHEVRDRYWVDVLIAPENRTASQNEFSRLLRDGHSEVNFQAELETRAGERRIIDWHGSIRPDIDQGRVGLVLFGIDITRRITENQALNHALDKWENIFTAVLDPALIVSAEGVILDVNPATMAKARRSREEIVGRGVCEILHGGRPPGAVCPLETLLGERTSSNFETELRGLGGNYLLNVSPLREYEGKAGAALLLARDLTEEQLRKAEAFRAAQLASVGELAAGVAHEINNPINGIINYAQILIDSGQSEAHANFLRAIIKEGQRIAGITRNLLEFSRKREESPEPVDIPGLIRHSFELIAHQYQLDGITLVEEYDKHLPLAFCNPQQLQQVLLNVFSNARYALNQRYPTADNNKRIVISVTGKGREGRRTVHIAITDYGTGIEHHIMDRLMDPFFSTKAKGEGTGLGLSISHNLIQENKGNFRIRSQLGKYTTILIDLPAAAGGDASHA